MMESQRCIPFRVVHNVVDFRMKNQFSKITYMHDSMSNCPLMPNFHFFLIHSPLMIITSEIIHEKITQVMSTTFDQYQLGGKARLEMFTNVDKGEDFDAPWGVNVTYNLV